MVQELHGQIRYSEIDSNGKLKYDALINYFQDCSFLQSENIGYGIQYLWENNRAWIISSWNISIKRLPKLKEEIVVKTWAYGFKSFLGYRNFSMETEDGELLCKVDSLWVYLDTETGKPARVPQEEMDAYGLSAPLEMANARRKFTIPEDMEEKAEVLVPSFFIDTNKHVNNGKYVMVASQYVPEGYAVSEIRVEYRKAAVCGDIMVPHTKELEDKFVVTLDSRDGDVYCVVEFLK